MSVLLFAWWQCLYYQKLYDKFPLTVHQMDIIIGVLFALILLFLVLGFTHTSFFGLFGG